jgi:hypothetical protein
MRKSLGPVAIAALAFVVFTPAVLAASTVVVTPGDVGTTWHTADTRPAGSGTFENGPASPPYGTGSFELSTMVGNSDKVQLLTNLFDGTRLDDIGAIGYSTYRTSDVYMVFEPYQDQGNGAVLTGQWQNWDAYRGGAAKWWINNGAGGCGQNTPCTFSAIVGLFPNATIREAAACGPANVKTPCPGSFGVNQGSFNIGILSNVDGLYIGVNGDTTTFDFELVPPPPPQPATKDDCKNGGWQTLGRADGSSFKNQGDCIQYVNTGK